MHGVETVIHLIFLIKLLIISKLSIKKQSIIDNSIYYLTSEFYIWSFTSYYKRNSNLLAPSKPGSIFLLLNNLLSNVLLLVGTLVLFIYVLFLGFSLLLFGFSLLLFGFSLLLFGFSLLFYSLLIYNYTFIRFFI
jgi:hypothetical protein